MKIKVTSKHIKNGQQGTSIQCPVALAIKDAGADGVSVGISDTTFFYHGGYYRFPLSRSPQRFIKKFDKNEKVKPFNFILDI